MMFKLNEIFLIIILGCISITLNAQESQNGKIKISLSGIPLVSCDYGYYGFVVKPGLEYFITNHFCIHSDLFYHIQSGYFISGIESRSSTFGLITSVRYNNSFGTKKWNFFGQLGVGFGSVLYRPIDDNVDKSKVGWLNSGIIAYSAGVGVGYRFTKLFEMEILIPYIIVDNITNSSNAKILFSGIGPTIGVKFSLNKNQ